MSLYELKNVNFRYKGGFSLNIQELTIERGSALGIAGLNGSGKSTLMRILAFLETPLSGDLYYKRRKITGTDAAARKNVTLLLQSPYLLKRSVYENVAYGLKVRGETKQLKQRVQEAMKLVDLSPEKFLYRNWSQLSGGEAQRVALASRLILNPEVLILDEPVANVDRESAEAIGYAVKKINKQNNTALVISSHDYYWLNGLSDRIIKLHNGRIIGTGIENIIYGPWKPRGDDLWKTDLPEGGSIVASGPPHEGAYALLDPSDIIIAVAEQKQLSAQNILKGKIINMSDAVPRDGIIVECRVSGIIMRCCVTRYSAEKMNLLPGSDVWLVFKASSLRWHGDQLV